ncbi:hypothetical protein GI584_14435 [Gracilibacillus salitolerans]|uniref:Uncharacterized protein n=1 Tax=Gracilibacillus salitolerans TaxID=2663022 RepID=A0A5Q2TMT5_9BACI|nr:hypothetical protein [Gracilibacillus salitolerans]QGH35170.1 hypothetical protein GI584_14435 [Gracilibacillus salitolerans]
MSVDNIIPDQETLDRFKERFEEIREVKDNEIKTIRLAALMTDMESAYDIPLVGPLRIAAFNQSFSEVMELYKQVSQARCF